MAYIPPENPVDFHFSGTGYAAPVGDAVDFQFLESADVARLSGELPSLTVNIVMNSALFYGALTEVDGKAVMSPSFYADIPFIKGNIVGAAYGFHADLIKLGGAIDAGIRRALFAGTLTTTTGKLYAGLYAAYLKKDLTSIAGGFKATPASLKKDLVTLKGTLFATSATFNESPVILSGAFYAETFKAYLDSEIKPFNGAFKLNAIGYVQVDRKAVVKRRMWATISNSGDYEFPISSVSASFRSSGSTITVVCPDGINYGDGIIQKNALLGTVMKVYSEETFEDGTVETDVKTYQSLDISYYRGANSYSITLGGTGGNTAPTTPREFILTGIQYQTLQANGAIRARAEMIKDLLPGDYCFVYGGKRIKVGQVQHIMTANTKAMEVAEDV